MLDTLFNKTVPSGVRDFISMKAEGYAPTSKKEIKTMDDIKLEYNNHRL